MYITTSTSGEMGMYVLIITSNETTINYPWMVNSHQHVPPLHFLDYHRKVPVLLSSHRNRMLKKWYNQVVCGSEVFLIVSRVNSTYTSV